MMLGKGIDADPIVAMKIAAKPIVTIPLLVIKIEHEADLFR
jgi:hypothetical protein